MILYEEENQWLQFFSPPNRQNITLLKGDINWHNFLEVPGEFTTDIKSFFKKFFFLIQSSSCRRNVP